jgi:hypothetical protein
VLGMRWGGRRSGGVFYRFVQSGARDRPLRLTNLSPLGACFAFWDSRWGSVV